MAGLRLAAGVLLWVGCSRSAQNDKAAYLNLPAVKPVVSCDQLAKAELSQAAGAGVTIKSATVTSTEKGQYCKVTGNIEPTIGFEVDLPMEHWTQRYVEGGCGGMCGRINASVTNAGSCMPALNGEFVVAGDDMGHTGGPPGTGSDGDFAADMQKRIDFAYEATTKLRWWPRR